MDLKEIIKESIMDGVNQFISSTLDQIQEKNNEDMLRDLAKHEEMLGVAQCLLNRIGASGKFDKALKTKDEIWDESMIDAIILSGHNVEDTPFEMGNEIFYEQFGDLCAQWQETVTFLDNFMKSKLIQQSGLAPCMSEETLENACYKFYDDILELECFEGGLFSTRKLKKEIKRCSEHLSAVCTGYILNIHVIKASINGNISN